MSPINIIGQGSLPSEFIDVTRARMLVQPEPQYLHARWWKTALGVRFNEMAVQQLGISPDRALPSPGAPYTKPEQDRLLYSDEIIAPAAIDVVLGLGARPGDTIKTNRPVYQDSSYSLEERTIPSGTIISTEPIAVTGEQVPISVLRLGGPYSAEDGEVRPFGIERMDIERMVHSARTIVGLHFARDFDKFIDTVLVFLYETLKVVISPAGMEDISDPVDEGDYPMSHTILTRIEETLQSNDVPRFPDGRWVGVLTPRQTQQLKNDDAFIKQARYFKDTSPLYVGNLFAEWGESLRLYVSNTMPVYPAGVAVGGVTPTVPIYNAHFFGPGVIGSGVGMMPDIFASTQDNYQQRALLIWLMFAGFTVFDARLGCRVQTS
jgi:hypothetical protein